MARAHQNVLGPLEPLAHEHPNVLTHFLASIVESSDDAILTKDLNGIITSWNTGAQRLFGYTATEAVGQPVTILIPPDRQNEEPQILERIRRGERIDHYETTRVRKDGTFVHISLTVSPLRNINGAIIGASKIARDITERKRSHEQQQFLIRELQHRNANLFAVISRQSQPCRTAHARRSERHIERQASRARASARDTGPHPRRWARR